MTNDPRSTRMFAQACEMLWGQHWRGEAADALGLNRRTVGRISEAANAGLAYPVHPGVLTELSQRLETHSIAYANLAIQLERASGSVPFDPPGRPDPTDGEAA